MDDTDKELTQLHPNHVKVTRIVALLVALPFVVGAIVLEAADILPFGVFVIPVLLVAAFLVIRIPLRRYHARGYDMGADRLRVVKGILFRSDTVVPFGRIQHIDVHQGPLQRIYAISSLIVHTAGTHNSSVLLPGLGDQTALEMREEIRAHIKRETV